MSKTDQMSFFGFEPEAAGEPAKPAKALKPEGKVVTAAAPAAPQLVVAAPPAVPAAALSAQVSDPEAMAQVLAQHPDFRVLRRLQPVTDYGGLQGQPHTV
jgi:DNA polymerase III subunit epsilon